MKPILTNPRSDGVAHWFPRELIHSPLEMLIKNWQSKNGVYLMQNLRGVLLKNPRSFPQARSDLFNRNPQNFRGLLKLSHLFCKIPAISRI